MTWTTWTCGCGATKITGPREPLCIACNDCGNRPTMPGADPVAPFPHDMSGTETFATGVKATCTYCHRTAQEIALAAKTGARHG